MAGRVHHVLYLCTGNSARSILAEALTNHRGAPRFRAFSAGSFPTGRVQPMALALLKQLRIPAPGARSKSWEEFSAPGSPVMDFVFTVCDRAAGEVCPVWPGQPMTANWSVDDPVAARGSEAERMLAFREAFRLLEHRVRLLVDLPVDALDRRRLQQRLDEIGRSRPGS